MAVASPIRVGIVGVGRAGWGMHRPELNGHGGYRIIAACDLVAERAQMLADAADARAYTDYRDLVNDPEVDLVVVATRSDTHAEVDIAALEAGKHVVAEKPFATSLAEADRIIAAAAKARGRLLVRQNRRFDPAFLHIREILASGRLGELYQVRLCRHGYQRRNDWQTLRAFQGGQLNNWGPHIIDHALQLIAAPVASLWSDLRNVAAAGDAEDHLKIVLRGANGVVADIEISGGVALGSPIWHLVGTQGALVSDERSITLKWYDRAAMAPVSADPGDPPLEGGFANVEAIPWQSEEISVAPARPTSFYAEVHRALTEGSTFPVSLEEARAVVQVTELARAGTGF
ncbi:MAG: Gfo/Idh/MocA family oxidoreductase [Armatimonadetes bacterium]|nr:Gfo/Idh/MocA family oxidoreductase [Armatimonadota bacterium]